MLGVCIGSEAVQIPTYPSLKYGQLIGYLRSLPLWEKSRNDGKSDIDMFEFELLFFPHLLTEFTEQAGEKLLGVRSLNLSIAAGTGHRPADPAAVQSPVDSMGLCFGGSGANTLLVHLFPSALFELPAILVMHMDLPLALSFEFPPILEIQDRLEG